MLNFALQKETKIEATSTATSCLHFFAEALTDEDQQYSLDERAAIYEYEAGLTRNEAEATAVLEFSRSKESNFYD